MKNIKKFITTTILSAAIIVTSSISIFASPFNDVADTDSYKDAVVRLYGLGIIQGSNGNFKPNNNIIRGDLAKIVLNAIGKGKLTSINAKIYEDVNSKDYYAGSVNIASQLGILNGSVVNGKKYFKPKDNVKLSELAKIMVKCLGYGDTDLEGSWPFNYISKATDLNLFDGINNIDPDYKVTRSDVAVMINNMLNTPTKVESTKDNPKSLFELTKSKYGIKIDTGAIITSQFDSTIAANHVRINNVDYEVGLSNPQDLLSRPGQIATVYIKDNKIVFATNIQGTSKSVVASRDAGTGVIYFKDAGSTQEQTASISSAAKIIINGKSAVNLTSIKNGANIILVNNDNNSDYDYVIATQMSAPIIITSDITSNDPVVVSSSVAGLNLRKSDGTAAQVTVTGAATTLSQIKRYDVVYPSASESNDAISLYVVRNSITGPVTGTFVPTADTLGRVIISGNTYNVKNGVTINLGDNKTFVLDKDNTIIAVIDNGSNPIISSIALDHYGIITGSGAFPDQWTGTTIYKVRFTKLDGSIVELQTAALLSIDAYKNQLVSYSLNANNIASIQSVGYSPLRKINIVSDTAIYAITTNTDGSFNKVQRVNASDINLVDSMALFAVVKPNNLMGDYSVLVLVNPTLAGSVSTDISGYGCIIGKTGSALSSDGVTAVDVYDVFINGAKQTINVKKDAMIPSIFSKLISTGGIVTTGLDIASSNKIIGKITAPVDALNYRIKINDTILSLDISVRVYNVSNNLPKLASLGDVTPDMANNATLVTDPTSGKVVMIIINK